MAIEKINVESNTITFTEDQRRYIEKLAKARNESKRPEIREHDSGYHDHNDDRAYPHMIGMAAELAYSLLTGKPVDETIHKDSGDYNDFDGVEVKGTSWDGRSQQLIVKQRDFNRKKPEIYTLIWVDREYKTAKYIGSIIWDDFNKKKIAHKHKIIDNFYVESTELKKQIVAIFGKDIKVFYLRK